MATSLKLDDDTRERVRHAAERRERTPHWIMKKAVEEYLERDEARESFRQEALASLSAYREDGRHLTLSETLAWLDRWKDDGKAPECHQ